MSEAVADYAVHAGDPGADRDALLSIWRGSLGSESAMRAKYDWFYLGCPHGAPLVRLLRHVPSGAWAGTCSAGARRMLLDGRPIVARLLADLAVLPEHRSLGPALAMQRELLAAALAQSTIAYGFPNPRAVALVQRAGARKIAEMTRYVRVLRHDHYLRRRMSAGLAGIAGAALDLQQQVRGLGHRLRDPHIAMDWTTRADARMDALWQASAPAAGWTAIRDSAHLNWRFDGAPNATVRYLCLGNGDALQAWFAVQPEDGLMHVRDFWSSGGMAGMEPECIRALLRAARDTGAVALSVEIATGPRQLQGWTDCGFAARSRRPVHGAAATDIALPCGDQLLLTAADEDE